ncbi:NADH-ubiquinone oxidoreductase chain H [Rhodobacter sp. AKP1]|nr:NADH-ubiquinone oxidoreductase chain H [Rhodobacter sp. AKP1]
MSVLLIALFSLILLLALLGAAGVFTWGERRLLGFLQERLGPNRVGPFGFLQWVADTLKLLTKEDAPPAGADLAAYRLAPALAAFPMLAGFGVVAFAPRLVISDLDVGVLFVMGMLALTVWALVLGAWGSRNRYAMLGGLRAAAQMLAYESFLGLSLMGCVLLAGSFRMGDIVAAQEGGLWFILLQPLGAALFFLAGLAAAHRLPFDLQESEQDLVAGFMTEYSGMSFALFFLGEYLAILLVAALFTTLFLGGWAGPILPGPVWFGLKIAAISVVFVWLRAALPRPRYDQLISFAWKVALPLALLNLLVTAWIAVGRAA